MSKLICLLKNYLIQPQFGGSVAFITNKVCDTTVCMYRKTTADVVTDRTSTVYPFH